MPNLPANMDPRNSFQGLILTLQRFWADQGCVILQPYDMPMGAGTSHTATVLRALGTLEGTLTLLTPGVDIAAEAHAYAADRVSWQIAPS